MTDIYKQHDIAFRAVSAAAILKDGKHVANVKFKHGGAVTAYVHWIGLEMVKGRAGGGGYDRMTAAAAHAARNLPTALRYEQILFRNALLRDGGARWDSSLRAAGFDVIHVIG